MVSRDKTSNGVTCKKKQWCHSLTPTDLQYDAGFTPRQLTTQLIGYLTVISGMLMNKINMNKCHVDKPEAFNLPEMNSKLMSSK